MAGNVTAIPSININTVIFFIVRFVFIVPDGFKDVCSGVDLARVAHEEFEDVEFRGSEPEFFPAESDEFFGGRKFKASNSENIGKGRAELNSDAREEFVEVVGFDDVVVGKQVEELDFLVGAVVGSKDNDADIGVIFETDKDVAPGSVWEGEVEEHEVRSVFSGVGEALHDAVGVAGVVAGGVEFVLEDRGDVGVVFDDEDMGHGLFWAFG